MTRDRISKRKNTPKKKTKQNEKEKGTVFSSRPLEVEAAKRKAATHRRGFGQKFATTHEKKAPKKKNKREISPSSLSFRSGKVSLAFLFAPKRICLFVGVDGEGGGVGREPKRKKKNEILQKKRAHKKGKDNPIKNAGQQ